MISKRYFVLISVFFILIAIGCKTVKSRTDGTVDNKEALEKEEKDSKVDKNLLSKYEEAGDKLVLKNREFLEYEKKTGETFRVLLTSDHYIVSQLKFRSTITRVEDNGGDRYISDEIKKLNKIDEIREGLITLWLYPDSGSIMKVRPQRPTYIVEIDRLLTEDIQRWNFKFPKTVVHPTRFDVKYRVILRKTISDEDILKEVQQKMRDES